MNKKTFANLMSCENREWRASAEQYSRLLSVCDDTGGNSEIFLEESSSDYSNMSVMSISETSDSAPENDTVECDSALEIKKWAIANRVSHNVVTHLLQVLRRIGVKDLPLSAKTLFKTNTKKAVIQSIPSGEFLYRGIQHHFKIGEFAFLHEVIGSDFYFLFLLLHTGIRLLSSQKSLKTEADVAQNILQEFVYLFGQIFGDYLVSYNVHGLLHITDCARQYGTLDSFSAYKFENYMQYLKKIVKKPNKILEQIYFRLEEGNDVENISKIGAFKIDHKKEKDSYCFSRKVGPVKIIGIDDYLIGYSFGKLENYLF